jgi:glycosyltransferase involved in cell wall biosynthesis
MRKDGQYTLQGTQKIKILIVYGGIMQYGGIEAFIMNYFRNLDLSKFQIDFVQHGVGNGVYDSEILNKNSKIFYVPTRSRHPIGNIKELKKIMQSSNYDIVYSHMDAANYYALKIAKQCKVSCRISHSHNTQYLTNNILKKMILSIVKQFIPKYATHLLACSQMAGRWLYSRNAFDVIPNAIDFNKYQYSERMRKDIRESLNITDDVFVIGHIGRFEYQKNHEYIIKIFQDVFNQRSNSILVLVGIGTNYSNIQKMVNDLGLQENVRFLGKRSDIQAILSAVDCFILPSRFEGLPLVLVEAQASGLPCFASKGVSAESNILGLVRYIDINQSSSVWAEKILAEDMQRTLFSREEFIKTGYEITDATKKLERLFLGCKSIS